MSDTITITLPLPPKVLHPNGRTRNQKWKWKATQKYREECAIIAFAAVNGNRPRWKLAECQCTFYLERRRDHDGLIAWMKSGFDSLQKIIIENDSGLIHLPPIQITAAAAKGRREVVLELKQRT